MQSDTFINTLVTLGLKVSDDGKLMYRTKEYGVVQSGILKRTREKGIVLDDVADVSFTETVDELHLIMNDMSEITVSPTRVNPENLNQETYPRVAASIEADGTISVHYYPTTFKGMVDEFDFVFPEWRDKIYYDELAEKIKVDISLFDRPSRGFEPWTDTTSSYYHYAVEDRMKALGFMGKKPPTKEIMDEAVLMQANDNAKNTFRDWVEGLVWDGVPRVATWFQDVFGGTAPALDPDEEKIYLEWVSKTWFLGAMERMYHPFQHDIVPVFISGQGAGKTRALRYTAANDMWYCMTSVDVTGPKGAEQFLDATRGRIIVELGEATQIRTKEVDKLKEFISKPSDQMRKAYAHNDQEYPRHYIMAATSNISNLFTDVTGNRRFFPIVCDPKRQTAIFSTDDRSVGMYEVEQMWAEVYHLYKCGVKATLPPNVIKLAQRMQDFSSKENSSLSVIDDWLDNPVNQCTAIGTKLTKNQIIEMIFGTNPLSSQYKEHEMIFSVWANGTKSWKSCKPFRIKGDPLRKTYRGWERIHAPGEDIELETFNIVTGEDDPRLREVKAQAEIRKLHKRYKFKEFDPLPPDVTKDNIDLFMEFGYIVDTGTPSDPHYQVVCLP